jgi:hypothetical protein
LVVGLSDEKGRQMLKEKPELSGLCSLSKAHGTIFANYLRPLKIFWQKRDLWGSTSRHTGCCSTRKVVTLSYEDWAMRKLVIGSGATLIAIGGVLAANAEPVTKAGAVQVTEKTTEAKVGKHKLDQLKLNTDAKFKIDIVDEEGDRTNKLTKEAGWKLAPNGENKLKAGDIKLSPSSASGILKLPPDNTAAQSGILK